MAIANYKWIDTYSHLVRLLRPRLSPARHCGVNAAHKEEIMSFSSIPEMRLVWRNSGFHGGVYYGLVVTSQQWIKKADKGFDKTYVRYETCSSKSGKQDQSDTCVVLEEPATSTLRVEDMGWGVKNHSSTLQKKATSSSKMLVLIHRNSVKLWFFIKYH
jgi:hypothetical protein